MPYACFTNTSTNRETWWEISEIGGCGGAMFFCDEGEFRGEKSASVVSVLRKGHPDLAENDLVRTDHEDLPDRLLARIAKYRLMGEW